MADKRGFVKFEHVLVVLAFMMAIISLVNLNPTNPVTGLATGDGGGEYGVSALPNCTAACGGTISASCKLNQSLTECTGNGLVINTSNVVLDCNGHNVSGNYDGTGNGVYINGDLSNVTVKNCTIYGFTITSEESGIYVRSGTNHSIIYNNLYDNGYGIYSNARGVRIEFNVIYNSTFTGIDAENLFSGTINGNNISYTTYVPASSGIFLNSNYAVNITNNTIYSNSRGIYIVITPTNKKIWHNNIYSNTKNIFVNNPPFEASYNNEGNYWGRSSCPYFIASTDSNHALVVDHYPYASFNGWLTGDPADCAPPTWNETPTNQVAALGVAFSYDVNASDNVAVGSYFINDTSNFKINPSTGLIENDTELSLGVYGLNISVNDTSNNILSEAITITVQDLTAPTFSSAVNTSADFKVSSNFTANITIDNANLSSYLFSTNASGSWANTSSSSISGTQYNASEQATITVSGGSSVCWYYWASDAYNNNATSSTYCFTVVNSAPVQGTPTISSASGNDYETDDLTCQASATDADGDNIAYTGEWYRNGSVFIGEYWNATYDSGGSSDKAQAVAVDSSGNVYVAGYSVTATWGYYTIKYDSAGNEVWSRRYDGGYWDDEAYGIAVDSSGNVFVTGSSSSGVGIAYYDLYTIKYDTNGNQLWNATYDGGEYDRAYGVVVDSEGNAYVTGFLRIGGNFYCVTIKYNGTDGSRIWNTTFYVGAYGAAKKIGLDSAGNVYVAGTVWDGADYNYLTIKYDSSGNYVWNRTYKGGMGYGIAVDAAGNVYVTGRSNNGADYDYLTVKYDSSGNYVWNRTYDGGNNDYGRSVALDAAGSVYVTGDSNISTDYDYYTIKYDSAGNKVWHKAYNEGNDDSAYEIATDSAGNFYVTGATSNGTKDNFYTIKYKDGFAKENQMQGQLAEAGTLGSQFTSVGDNWSCGVRAYDGEDYSSYAMSANLTILAVPAPSGGGKRICYDACQMGETVCRDNSMYICGNYDSDTCTEWITVDCRKGLTCEDGRCVPLPCVEDWVCREWTPCINRMQERECADWNNCGTMERMPEVQRACVVEGVKEEALPPEEEEVVVEEKAAPLEEMPGVLPWLKERAAEEAVAKPTFKGFMAAVIVVLTVAITFLVLENIYKARRKKARRRRKQ